MDLIDSTTLNDAVFITAKRDQEDAERAAAENLRRFDYKKERDEEVRKIEQKWASKMAELEEVMLRERRELKTIRDNEDARMNEQRSRAEGEHREKLKQAMERHKAISNSFSFVNSDGRKENERDSREQETREYKQTWNIDEARPKYTERFDISNGSSFEIKSPGKVHAEAEPIFKSELENQSLGQTTLIPSKNYYSKLKRPAISMTKAIQIRDPPVKTESVVKKPTYTSSMRLNGPVTEAAVAEITSSAAKTLSLCDAEPSNKKVSRNKTPTNHKLLHRDGLNLSREKFEPNNLLFKSEPDVEGNSEPQRKKAKFFLDVEAKKEKDSLNTNLTPNPASEPKYIQKPGFIYNTELFPITGLDTPEWFWLRSIRHMREPTKDNMDYVFRWGPEDYGVTNYSLRLLEGIYTPWVMGTPMRMRHKAWMIEATNIYKVRYNFSLQKAQVTQRDAAARETDVWFEFREPHGMQNFLASLPNKVIFEELERAPPGWAFSFQPQLRRRDHE